MTECMHGMEIEWCGICTKASDTVASSRLGSYGYHGGETKQDVLDDICRLLGIPCQPVSMGSSLPSDVFAEAALQVDVPHGPMPEICEAIVLKAGHIYSPSFDSRASSSGGGSTVTLEGIRAMRRALEALLA